MLASIVTSDWAVWEKRLWSVTNRDPGELSLRAFLSIVEGFLLDERDAQGREILHALFEDRLPLNLQTGKVLGLESSDPDVRHRARLMMLEQKRKERERGE